jgi:hypothetical protein
MPMNLALKRCWRWYILDLFIIWYSEKNTFQKLVVSTLRRKDGEHILSWVHQKE